MARLINLLASLLLIIFMLIYARELDSSWVYFGIPYTLGLLIAFIAAAVHPISVTNRMNLALLAGLWAGMALYPYALNYSFDSSPAIAVIMIGLLGWFSLWWIRPHLKALLHSRPFTLNLLVMNISVVSMVLLTFMLELYVIRYPPQNAQRIGIIYTPHSTLEHQTVEFTYAAHINNYGFRGADVKAHFAGDCRVMLVGDSYTYGWGVEYPNTWGAQLETALDKEIEAEILNLGYPGVGPQTYAAVVAQAAPIFEPDIIVVSLLQGDDLMQAEDVAQRLPALLSGGGQINQFLHRHYPNITRYLFITPQYVSQAAYRDTWIEVAEDALQQYPYAFDHIDSFIQSLYKTGQLNPYMIAVSQNTDYFTALLNPEQSKIQAQISAMGKALNSINEYAPQLIVASIPYRAYVSDEEQALLGELGIHTVPEMVTTTTMDDVVQLALDTVADKQNIRFFEATQVFREASEILYFRYDGHFTIAGNRLFAEQIYPVVQEACLQVRDSYAN
ncbi:MAG: SGNH/GDSL hydrolase family protein [Anaerolineales bacterium]|nr:SGNH/GDSL hydrolase family protein [Anaerolineales bacterium]